MKMKNVNELRVAGRSKQFADELSYLIEGLKASALNVRRSTSLELSTKLLNESFIIGIRPHSSIRCIFKLMVVDDDPVFIF
jgi:hypothetical protein